MYMQQGRNTQPAIRRHCKPIFLDNKGESANKPRAMLWKRISPTYFQQPSFGLCAPSFFLEKIGSEIQPKVCVIYQRGCVILRVTQTVGPDLPSPHFLLLPPPTEPHARAVCAACFRTWYYHIRYIRISDARYIWIYIYIYILRIYIHLV